MCYSYVYLVLEITNHQFSGDRTYPFLQCRILPGFEAVRSAMASVPQAEPARGAAAASPAQTQHRGTLFTTSPLPANKAGLFNKHPTNKTDLKLDCLFHEWKFPMKINIFRDKKVHLKRVLSVQSFRTDNCWCFVWIAVGLSSNICLQ